MARSREEKANYRRKKLEKQHRERDRSFLDAAQWAVVLGQREADLQQVCPPVAFSMDPCSQEAVILHRLAALE